MTAKRSMANPASAKDEDAGLTKMGEAIWQAGRRSYEVPGAASKMVRDAPLAMTDQQVYKSPVLRHQDPRMTTYVFPPPPVVAIPIVGSDALFPVRRIFCVGRNYEEHAKEMGQVVDREKPFYFTKSPGAIVMSGATIPYAAGTTNYHYEMELVVAIGMAGAGIAKAEALSHVFGYACGLDMTRRDLQLSERAKQRPWDLGKDVEFSAPVSALAPASRGGHPEKARIELRQNGVTKQSASLTDLVWSIPELIAHLSGFYRLEPGDLIFTGTPAGVGPVQPGDVLEGSVEGVGALKVTIGPAA